MQLHYNTLVVLSGTAVLGALSGLLGTWLVLRRRALVSDAAAHAALPGLCIAFMIIGSRKFGALLLGAMASALIGAWLVGLIHRHTRIKEDAAIGMILSTFFGLGVALSRYIQSHTTGAAKAGLDTFIFGKTAGMLVQDVYIMIGIGVVVLVVTAALYKEFNLISFDPGFANVQGWPVHMLDVLMLLLVCATTVIGLPAVGLVMMAALLIIPAAAARFWTDRLGVMMILASTFGVVTALVGTLLSARYPSVPTGPVIILAGTGVFLASMFFAPQRGMLARVLRHFMQRRRIASQNLLRTLYELSEADWPEARPVGSQVILRERAWSRRRLDRLASQARKDGLIISTPGGHRLTDEGWRRAAEVVRAHRLWEIFLIEEAQAAASMVDRDAERLEHVLPADMVLRLEQRLIELGLLPVPLQPVPARHAQVAQLEEPATGGAANA